VNRRRCEGVVEGYDASFHDHHQQHEHQVSRKQTQADGRCEGRDKYQKFQRTPLSAGGRACVMRTFRSSVSYEQACGQTVRFAGPTCAYWHVPMMMVLKVICDHVEALQPVGHLMGD
jgi:hypothetical protein